MVKAMDIISQCLGNKQGEVLFFIDTLPQNRIIRAIFVDIFKAFPVKMENRIEPLEYSGYFCQEQIKTVPLSYVRLFMDDNLMDFFFVKLVFIENNIMEERKRYMFRIGENQSYTADFMFLMSGVRENEK